MKLFHPLYRPPPEAWLSYACQLLIVIGLECLCIVFEETHIGGVREVLGVVHWGVEGDHCRVAEEGGRQVPGEEGLEL